LSAVMSLAFTKMHGAGNDFVVLDRRTTSVTLDAALVARMADRHRGVGFDQLLTLEMPTRGDCDASYLIWNADGSAAQQCGNGVRCLVAWLVRADASGARELRLQGPAGIVACRIDEAGAVHVNMGVPRFDPAAVPFGAEADALEHEIEVAGERLRVGVVSMGNPHAVLVVDDVGAAPVAQLGAALESHRRFPDRCNVGFAQVVDNKRIRLRVYERGVGETLACGTGACAAVAVLRRRSVLGDDVAVELPGGTLRIAWQGEGAPLWMSGPAAFVFEGIWTA
jgi:diaminopimelate epimerase